MNMSDEAEIRLKKTTPNTKLLRHMPRNPRMRMPRWCPSLRVRWPRWIMWAVVSQLPASWQRDVAQLDRAAMIFSSINDHVSITRHAVNWVT